MMLLSDYDLLLAVRKLPRLLIEMMKQYPGRIFVAGGYLRSIITSEPISDIDVFCDTPELAKACAQWYADESKKKAVETRNAITIYTRPHLIQFIHRWTFRYPADCVQSFDFTIARAAIWWGYDPRSTTDDEVQHWCSICDERYYPDLAAKRLIYCAPARIEEAGGSMLRVLKFYQKGYHIPVESLAAVIARCVAGIDGVGMAEERIARCVKGLLREVDPLVDPDHISHLPHVQGAKNE